MTSAAVRQVAVDDQGDARRRAVAASTPCSSVPVRRPIRPSSPSTTANRAWTAAASSVQRRSTWAWPEAGAQVVARRRRPPPWRRRGRSRPPPPRPCAAATCGQQRADDGQYGADARRAGRGRTAGHQVRPATTHSGPEASRVRIACQTLWRSSSPTSWVSSSTRSSTSPTACSVSAESGWCIAASSRSARSRPSARSTTPAQIVRATVSRRARADDAQRRAATTSVEVACSASRPATSDPRDAATAPNRDIVKHTTVSGRRTRRQSTGTRPPAYAASRGVPSGVVPLRVVVPHPGDRHNP